MKPLDLLKQADSVLTEYRIASGNRIPMLDLTIWHTLEMYYESPDEYDLVVTSTKEEAFERMLADNWSPFQGRDFYGIDYEIIDEVVLDYLVKSQLATHVDESR